ncbi:MAG: dihydrolipoamide acetyltransferase family protein [Anaerolineales bacterium]
MAKPIIMPRFGMTQEEATIVRWLVKEGDHVEYDDPIAEVTTDKVNMEVPAPSDGFVGGFQFEQGDTVPVTQVIAFVLEEGEEPPEVVPSAPEPESTEAEDITEPETAVSAVTATASASPVAQRMAASEGIDLSAVQGSGPEGRVTRKDIEQYMSTEQAAAAPEGKVRATPAARRAAHEGGMVLQKISGSGPRGRVQEADVLAAEPTGLSVASPFTPRPQVSGEPVKVPLEGLRKTIAERMQRSSVEAPHITFTLNVDMTRMNSLRTSVNQRAPNEESRVSMTALLAKITAWALRRHPYLNAYMQEDHILLLPNINVGIATAIPEGLIVPVVKDADLKGLYEIASEVRDLSSRAREGALNPDDVVDGTFTISNLGMFGIDQFTAIINPPQVAILAIGRTENRFVPDEQGNPVSKPIMSMTLSADHRALDGAIAAQFLDDLRAGFEEPGMVLL